MKFKFILSLFLSLLVSSPKLDNYTTLEPSIIFVKVHDGSGSGFPLKINGNLIVITAGHVTHGSKKVTLIFNDGTKEEDIAVESPNLDVSFIRVKKKLTPLLIDTKPVVSEKVFAIGNPLDFRNFYSEGTIGVITDDYIITTTNLMPGSSGCPLFDGKGKVLGMADQILVNYPTISYFIPIADIKKEAEKLLNK